MDVLRPRTVWINGSCYRKTDTGDDDEEPQVSYSTGGDAADVYEEDDAPCTNNDDILVEDISKFDTLPNGLIRGSLHVANEFFAFIIGKKGATKKRLELETNTKIVIPRQGATGDIEVTGKSRSSVVSALNRIHLMALSARERQEFTHFVSLPLNVELMKEAFAKFLEEVLEKCGSDRGIDRSVFQNPNLLHLTIGTMSLMDNVDREKATKLLNECKEEIFQPLVDLEKGLSLEVDGLEIMNDDPGEVDVVYAKVAPTNKSTNVQELADRIVEKFVKAGLMKKQYDRVKLHLTLMNTLFRKDEAGIADNEIVKKKPRESLNAKNLLEIFGQRKFATVKIEEVHISQRRGRKTASGYYSSTAVISLID